MFSNNGFPSHFKEAVGLGEMIISETNMKMIRMKKIMIKRFIKKLK